MGGDLPETENGTRTRFRPPGAFHHARWMAKTIYALKIYMFREQFNLTTRETNGLRKFCIFVIRLYIKPWFTATNPIRAPKNDLDFLESLSCIDVDENIRKTVLSKFCNHLWYLGEELVSLAFFDPTIDVETKRRMVSNLKYKESLQENKRRYAGEITQESLAQLSIEIFVSKHSLIFFKKLRIDAQFDEVIKYDPIEWLHLEVYNECFDCVKNLHVVNDAAERSVCLIKKFNSKSKTESQIQAMCQVVKEHRKFLPTSTKNNLVNDFVNYIEN